MPLPRWALLRRASGSKKTPEPEGMQYLSLWETAILGLETHLQTSAGCLGCKTRLCNYAMLTSPRAKLRPQSPEGRSLRSYSTSLHLTITTTITTIMLTRTIMTIIVMIIIIILTMMIIMIIMIMISIIIRKHETFMLTNVATYRRWLSFPPRGLLAGAVFPTPGPSTLLYSTLLYSTLLYSTLLCFGSSLHTGFPSSGGTIGGNFPLRSGVAGQTARGLVFGAGQNGYLPQRVPSLSLAGNNIYIYTYVHILYIYTHTCIHIYIYIYIFGMRLHREVLTGMLSLED